MSGPAPTQTEGLPATVPYPDAAATPPESSTPALGRGSRISSYQGQGRSLTSVTIDEKPRRKFKSSRLVGEYEKPWLADWKRETNWDSIIFYSGVLIALCISAYIAWNTVRKIPKNEYCLILDDRFTTLDKNTWSHEIQMNGFGTGSFDWTTDDPSNSYVDEQGLHIVPTLTLQTTKLTEDQMLDKHVVNLTRDGTCTFDNQRLSNLTFNNPCWARSNATSRAMINPVRSARLTTSRKKSIKYGRVEVEAKLPSGDWMWPAIWMMPQDSVYGEWPRSGEIDIMESRGNDAEKYPLGNNIVSSAMHWGTLYDTDAFRLSMGEWGSKRTKYSDKFHTFGLEWNEKYLFTWLDGRLRQIVFFDFTKNKNMWEYGKFAGITVNKTVHRDTWSQTGRSNTPFDQDFYLILNVAVGSTNGWFPDKLGEKPWSDESSAPMRDFWDAKNTWLPSWGEQKDRGMIVRSVKMWQEGACSS
ncbi:Glycoside hydrolase family 16 [Fusarium keratoplasticum]|uniref:Glycoside hydrolase family 16 n=1 Tax=Fusarium keratoplasticum TaxID=1328300 RepID=A0ACC0R341_9HYPO|nr:Glycoside hydrolase family 16 [Fusarium keratoplasticum]KAI8674518.1 Glycoside hydrolase family 16 [Fusarium keratoplasticum]KAI8681008.1 Glycoside hydrolase family 16 [Fusarium keratoplasticum]